VLDRLAVEELREEHLVDDLRVHDNEGNLTRDEISVKKIHTRAGRFPIGEKAHFRLGARRGGKE